MEDVELDGNRRDSCLLILSDSYVRGEFYAGQRVQAEGELVTVEKGDSRFDALIVANNWDVKTVS
jgi:hypothetical protein